MQISEQEMKAALFGPKRQRVSLFAAAHNVVLSVRKDYHGLPFQIEIKVPTMSHLDAWTQAHQLARTMGYTVWCVVDIQKIVNEVSA